MTRQLGTEIGVVWIASNPRTGSMWTANVVREVVAIAGFDPLPKDFLSETERLAYGSKHANEALPGVAVLKVHGNVPPLPRSAGIVTRRDVRDNLVSYMRFMETPFEQALNYARTALSRPPELIYAGEHRLVLDYPRITEAPAAVVEEIAGFLSVELSPEQCQAIAAKFEKGAVAGLIRAAEADVKRHLEAGETLPPGAVIKASANKWRARDLETGFQSGHVSGYQPGDWKTALTNEQQQRLGDLIEAAGSSMA